MDTLNFRGNLQSTKNKKNKATTKNIENEILEYGEIMKNHIEPKNHSSNNLKMESVVKMEASGVTIRSDVLAIGSNYTEVRQKSCFVNTADKKNSENEVIDYDEIIENSFVPKSDTSRDSNIESTVKMEVSGATIRSDVLVIGSNSTEISENSSFDISKPLENLGKDNKDGKARITAEQKSDIKINLKGTTIYANLTVIGSNFNSLRNHQFSEKSSSEKSKCLKSLADEDNDHGKIWKNKENQSQPVMQIFPTCDYRCAFFAITFFVLLILFFGKNHRKESLEIC